MTSLSSSSTPSDSCRSHRAAYASAISLNICCTCCDTAAHIGLTTLSHSVEAEAELVHSGYVCVCAINDQCVHVRSPGLRVTTRRTSQRG